MEAERRFSVEAITGRLATVSLGRRIDLYPQVGSTNDLAREAGRRGAREGLAIVAEEQVRGRGRLGRTWVAPPGSSILCSVLLRPRFSPADAFYLTIAAALAILRAVRAEVGSAAVQSTLKWPNDVRLNGRKVAGILCESELKGGEWDFAIVGFGINANLAREGFGDLAATATSLSAELGREVDRAALLARVLGELEGCYYALQNGQMPALFQAWQDALETLGKPATVSTPEGQLSGTALRVDPDGALVLKLPDGQLRRVHAGDVL